MKRDYRYQSFGEFWPFYLSEHSRAATRWLHLIGTTAGIALLVYLIASGRWWLFLLALVPGVRVRVARAFPDREEQARDVQVSTLVVYGRLQNDRADAYRAHQCRGQKGCAVISPFPKFRMARTSGSWSS